LHNSLEFIQFIDPVPLGLHCELCDVPYNMPTTLI
jgi:hypothetical protein